jgi:hypothetical protein
VADNHVLQDWIERRGTYAQRSTGARGSVVHALRLLCVIGRDPAGFQIGAATIKTIVERLGLPKWYPADSVAVRRDGRQYVVDRRLRAAGSAKQGYSWYQPVCSPTGRH